MATALTEDNFKEMRIKTVLGRLELIIDNENERIGKDVEFDIKASNAHKSRCLYELTMLCKDSAPSELPNGLSTQMKFLKQKLMLNARRLEAHLNAVRTVTDILKTAAREQDGDGTYTQEQFRYGEI
ncbi:MULTISPECIES: hypothetical protein [unclassified Rhizobium]|uniref:hypothetical protein n=1 Tax=unclassified Rhizobium TaxID=2613769 RepID=UPI0015FED5A2|nr:MULTISPECIES: hypothetical protein [unclassified Rhizobium]MBB1248739.1 hypothetical protein [Rhizobium sp. G21]MCV3766266.1 hypothetical protein [Rhizobium sp. TRM95796]